MTPTPPPYDPELGLEPVELEAVELAEFYPGVEHVAPGRPGPRRRTARTAVQAVLAFLGAIPAAWAALTAAGVELGAVVAALVLGIPAALVIVISAVWNAIDSRHERL